jgi:hypothetical protein
MNFQGFLKQSTSVNVTVLMIDSSDHVTGKAGLTLTIYLTKAGGTPASIAPTVTELDSTNVKGLYKLALTTTSWTDTLGELQLHVTSTGADPTDIKWQVVAVDLTDSVRAGLTALPNAAANAAGGLPVSAAGGLDLDEMNVDIEAIQTGVTVTTNNDKTGYSLVAGQILIKKNAALAKFQFIMRDSTTHAPKAGLTVAGNRNIDNAGFGATANSVAEVSNGWYTIDFAASDLNGVVIGVRFTATGADDTNLTFITQT